MPNGISRETFMNAQDETQKGMLFDIFEGIDNKLDNICKLPEKCEAKMDEKIKDERKRKGKISLGLGSGGGVGAFGIMEVIRRWLDGS